METVSFEDFKKLDLRIGKILTAEKVEGADKLLKLEVSFGSTSQVLPDGKISEVKEARVIIAGIAQYYEPDQLIGKECPFIVNLEPRMIKGLESQGMILAADDEGPVLLSPDKNIKEGSIIK